MEGITVITPTGGRVAAFKLCELWMSRQDFNGDVQWIVVNDCGDYAESIHSFPRTVINLPQKWGNTQHRNVLAALDVVKYPRIIFCEDDDYYSPTYLSDMYALMDKALIVGQYPTICYNVKFRAWLDYANEGHASLCMTGVREEVIPDLRRICGLEQFIDMALWDTKHSNSAEWRTRKVLSNEFGVLSIKGMPGRPGVMPQHAYYDGRFKKDEDLTQLRKFIGEDAEHYRGFYSQPVV